MHDHRRLGRRRRRQRDAEARRRARRRRDRRDPARPGDDRPSRHRAPARGVRPLLAAAPASSSAGGRPRTTTRASCRRSWASSSACRSSRSRARSSAPSEQAVAVRVVRVTPDGDETVEVSCPAIVTISNELGQPRYPTMAGRMAARKKKRDRRRSGARSASPTCGRGCVLARQFVPDREGRVRDHRRRDAGRGRGAPRGAPARGQRAARHDGVVVCTWGMGRAAGRRPARRSC